MTDVRTGRRTEVPAQLRGRFIAVLMGGTSSERDVSLASGRAVVLALEPLVEEQRGLGDLIGIEIGPEGDWILGGKRSSAAELLSRLPKETLFFLALHGGEGEGGAIQGLLDVCGFPYTGSGVAASALCLDKQATRLCLRDGGLPIAPGQLISRLRWQREQEHLPELLARNAPAGLFVKANSGGSSLHTHRVERGEDPSGAIEDVLASGDAALVESRILGGEFTAGVLGNRGAEPLSLPPVEIVPTGDAFFDYHEKYAPDGAAEFCPPRSIGESVCGRLQELALAAHELLGCDGYSRTDFILPRAEGLQADPIILEVNNLPGLTERSLGPQAAGALGVGFDELCLRILALGLAADRGRVR